MGFWSALLVIFLRVEVERGKMNLSKLVWRKIRNMSLFREAPWNGVQQGERGQGSRNWWGAVVLGGLQPGSTDRGELPLRTALQSPRPFWALPWGFWGPGAGRTPLCLGCLCPSLRNTRQWQRAGPAGPGRGLLPRKESSLEILVYNVENMHLPCLPHSRCSINISIFKEKLWRNESI